MAPTDLIHENQSFRREYVQLSSRSGCGWLCFDIFNQIILSNGKFTRIKFYQITSQAVHIWKRANFSLKPCLTSIHPVRFASEKAAYSTVGLDYLLPLADPSVWNC